jgi:hypothetical protein
MGKGQIFVRGGQDREGLGFTLRGRRKRGQDGEGLGLGVRICLEREEKRTVWEEIRI